MALGNLVLLRYDRPEHAWFWLQRMLARGCASTEEYFLAAVCLYQGLGRLGEATSLFARANDANFAKARSLGLANSPFRVLDELWARHIGDAATLDYVIKQRILAGSPREETILYLPAGRRIANRFLAQQLGACFRLVEHPDDLPFNPAAVQALNVHYQFPRQPDGTTAFFWEPASKIEEHWRQEGRGPLLELPADTVARGWTLLQAAGLPRGAWYVALHVRDVSWKGLNGGMQGIRNADMADYLPSITEVTRRGGYVVRMGDPDAPPLPPLANVIDYCRSDMRSDWMDIFLIACSRFMLASASGPSFIPPLYGVPAVLTNWWPPAARPWHASDIFVPKIPRRSADGRYLTLSETLREPFSWCHSRRYLAERGGVSIEDNDPEIIRGAVDEMLAGLDAEPNQDADTEQLRARADQIYHSHGVSGTGRLARDFLRRHGDFIA